MRSDSTVRVTDHSTFVAPFGPLPDSEGGYGGYTSFSVALCSLIVEPTA